MRCEHARELISARLDAEDLGVESEPLENHVGGCVACRRFEARAAALHRGARVQEADPVPDLTASILAAIGAEGTTPARRLSDVRLGLAAVAIVQLALAVPALLFGVDVIGGADGLDSHVARHLGAVEAGIGVGFLAAAWQPFRASGLFPVVATLGVGVLAVSALDLVAGRAAFPGEARHALDLAGLALLWLVIHPHRGFRMSHA